MDQEPERKGEAREEVASRCASLGISLITKSRPRRPKVTTVRRARASKTIKEILMGKRRIQSCLRTSFTICAVVLLSAASALAQMPDKFTNLQVLPKDISKKDLMSIM